MRIHSSLAAFLALVGSLDAFLPTANTNNHRVIELSVSSTDYLSALSRQAASAPASTAPKVSGSSTDYLSALSNGAPAATSTPPPLAANEYPTYYPQQQYYPNGGYQSGKAGPFDSMTPKAPVVQGGQIAEFQSPETVRQQIVSGGFMTPMFKAGPFDSMTPKDSVMQGGQTAEFQSQSLEMNHGVGAYQNHDPRPKAGPFDSLTPKAPVVQGGQLAEFQPPTAATHQEIRAGGFMNSMSKAGPFDTMTPKDPVVQGGQIAEFKPAPEAATVQQFPHDTTGWTSR